MKSLRFALLKRELARDLGSALAYELGSLAQNAAALLRGGRGPPGLCSLNGRQ